MKAGRFLLRLTTGLLCFALGWASALLLGAAGAGGRDAARRYGHVEIVVPHFEPPPPPRSEMPPLPKGGRACRVRVRPEHAHEWRDLKPGEDFGLAAESPLPPPKPRRKER
jgi:hypothetical protein